MPDHLTFSLAAQPPAFAGELFGLGETQDTVPTSVHPKLVDHRLKRRVNSDHTQEILIMPTSTRELQSFHQYAAMRIQNGGAKLELSNFLDEWKHQNPDPQQLQ